MAVLGFGCSDWKDAPRKHVPQFTQLPARFSLAVTSAATTTVAEAVLRRIATPAAGPADGSLLNPAANGPDRELQSSRR